MHDWPRSAGVLEDEDAPLGLLGADQPAGFEHVRPDLVVAEADRRDRARRLRRNERAEHLPQRRHAELVDALVEGAPLCALRLAAALVAIHRIILRHGASPLSGCGRRGYNRPIAQGGAVP